MDYWHIQMHLPQGKGGIRIDSSEMLKEQYPVIGTGEWNDPQCQHFKGEKNGLTNGNIIMVREGNKPLALCEIIGDYFRDEELSKKYINYWFRCVKVLDWADKNESNSLFSQGTLKRLKENSNTPSWNYINNWYNRIMSNKDMDNFKSLLTNNKNLILTGAPGTGKTYLAKQIAKQMIGATTDEELEKSGQFAFVQFHPSYDYTDFVEGLRPTKPDVKGNIGFELKDGVFKDFCKKAIGSIAVKHIEKFTLNDYEKYLQTIGLKEITIKNYKHRIEQLLGKELKARKQIVDKEIYSSLDDICENIYDIKDFDNNNNFHNQFFAAASNLKNFKESLFNKQHTIDKTKTFFIFIIDEINRGEISKIFGELFFSIDPSYRGEKGAVKTQYSNMHEDENEVFYIPENVYIIGTMNDIDRSVESFDFAMRRRFTWKEITAEQSAENMELSEPTKNRMKNLNNAISGIHGLNSSYHIGGAYFLDDEGKERNDYEQIWELRLRPLLFEYLRGMPENETDKLDKDLKTAYENDGQ